GRCVAERDVGVERRVLEAGGGLDRRDDLARDAELGKAAERGLLVGPKVPHRLVETDQPFLQQIVVVTARKEVRTRLEAEETRIPANQRVQGDRVAVPSLENELKILEFSLDFLRRACCRSASSHGASRPLRVKSHPVIEAKIARGPRFYKSN